MLEFWACWWFGHIRYVLSGSVYRLLAITVPIPDR